MSILIFSPVANFGYQSLTSKSRQNRMNNCNFQMEFLISYQCGWWAVRAREFTVVAATTTSTPIWWITTGNNGSGQNEADAAAAANLLLQTCLRPFHSIFSDKFLRRQLFFGLIIFSKLSVYSGRLHTDSLLFRSRCDENFYRILKTFPTGICLEKGLWLGLTQYLWLDKVASEIPIMYSGIGDWNSPFICMWLGLEKKSASMKYKKLLIYMSVLTYKAKTLKSRLLKKL